MMNLMDTLKKGIDREDAILIEKFPIKSLSLSKKAINAGMVDVRKGSGSFTKGPVEVMYNIENGQFIITDGYHRIVDYLSKKKQFIPIKIWSTTYSDYHANIQKDDLFFEPIPLNSFPSFGEDVLLEEQTNILNNLNFKKWFGNSKVVDKDGNPLKMYHGTGSDFTKFEHEKTGGVGFYFTSDPEEANIYAGFRRGENMNVMPVYLSIKNPATTEIEESIAKELQGRLGGNPRLHINRVLQQRGYDGIIRGTHMIAFSPNQIKSAIGNTGNFDINDPNILKEVVEELVKEALFDPTTHSGGLHKVSKNFWLNPDGKFIPIPMQGHNTWASTYVQGWPEKYAQKLQLMNPQNVLYRENWIKVVLYDIWEDPVLRIEYYPEVPPNQTQELALRRFIQEFNADKNHKNKITHIQDDTKRTRIQLQESIGGQKYDYIGGIFEGEVRAERLPFGKARFRAHSEFTGLYSGQNHTNWRYYADKNKVMWNLHPDPENVEKVNRFLEERGILNPTHSSIYRRLGENTKALNEWHQNFPLKVAIDPSSNVAYFWRGNRPAGRFLLTGNSNHPLLSVGVQRSLQGTGIGHAMIEFAFRKTKLNTLNIYSANSSRSFYLKIGGVKTKHPSIIEIHKSNFKPPKWKFEEVPFNTELKFNYKTGSDTSMDSNYGIHEDVEPLDERMSFADLYDDTDDERIFKSKLPGMRVRPMAISMENGNETWNFGYTSQEKAQYKRHRDKVGHKGRIIFFKDSVEPDDNAEDLECMVDCDCKDFQMRFAYVDAQQDASMIGPNSLNKAINRPPLKTNPEGDTKLCKHLAALIRYLVTNLDRARERAHLRRRPFNIFEEMDALTGKKNDTTNYYDKENGLNEGVNKIGYDPEHDHSDLPMDWDAIDIPTDRKWDEYSVRKFVGLPNNFIAIYPAIIDLNELEAHTGGDEESRIDDYTYDDFRFKKRGFPPIIVRRDLSDRLIVVDGNHRVYWAQRHENYQTIGAWVIDEIMQRDIMHKNKQNIKETRIITPEESLYEGYITLYHGTTWPLALKAKKGELGPQDMEKLIIDVLVNVYHETPQDAKKYYDKYSESRKKDPKALFLTTNKESAKAYATASTKYGGEIFLDVLSPYLWEKNKIIRLDSFKILKTDQPAIVTVNVPISMVLTHPHWVTPLRDRLRSIFDPRKRIQYGRDTWKDLNLDNLRIEVFVKENIPARFVQRIDRIKSLPDSQLAPATGSPPLPQ